MKHYAKLATDKTYLSKDFDSSYDFMYEYNDKVMALEYIGFNKTGVHIDDVSAVVVKIENGDYTELYVCFGSKPYSNNAEFTRVIWGLREERKMPNKWRVIKYTQGMDYSNPEYFDFPNIVDTKEFLHNEGSGTLDTEFKARDIGNGMGLGHVRDYDEMYDENDNPVKVFFDWIYEIFPVPTNERYDNDSY